MAVHSAARYPDSYRYWINSGLFPAPKPDAP